MAKRTPMVGSCTIEGASLANDVEFTFNVMQATTESGGIGDVFVDRHALAKSWGGHVSGWYDPEDPALAALITAAKSTTYDDLHMTSLSLYDNASAYYSGSCIITNVTVTKSMGSVDKFDFDFEGIGVFTYS